MNVLIPWIHAVAVAAPTTQVELNSRQLVGQTIILNIRVRNDTTEPIQFPDLTNRPWMLQFDIREPSGQKKTIQTTTPDVDPGGKWTIEPAQQRVVRFEVPGSRTWTEGSAQLRVRMDETTLVDQVIQMVTPQKDYIDQPANPADLLPAESTTLWTQKHGNEVDVFVEHRGTPTFLTSLKGNPALQLSVARADMNIGRWITWTGTDNKIWAMRTDARGIQETPFSLSIPWPNGRVCGRPATDSNHRLIQPICVLSPNGETSRLMVAITDSQTSPAFRSVSLHKPTQLLTNVNAAGHVDLVVVRPSGIDVYTVQADDTSTRPLASRRLFRGTGHTNIQLGMGGNPAQPIISFDAAEQHHEVPLTGPQ
ncbi:MAG: hypothetical protein ACPGTU_07210 [Myxococcota bacterium]